MRRYCASVLSAAAEREEQMTKHWTDKYAELNPCSDAMAWLKTQPNAKTAWATCQRGDWMLWLAGRLAGPPGSDSRRPLVLSACDCAELVQAHWPAKDNRPAEALRVARSWARNEGATLDDVGAGAVAAARAAAWAAAAWAAEAWAAAAGAVAAAAAAGAVAAAWAVAGAWAWAWAAEAWAREETLTECADIVRRYYPKPPSMKARSK